MSSFSESDPSLHAPLGRSSRSSRLLQGMLGVSLLTVLIVGGGALWLRDYLDRKLSPRLATVLSDRLDRPVEVGSLARYSLSSARFGASSLPATATDPDWATVEAIEISFNLWQAIRTRHVVFDLTLIKPTVYVEQGSNGNWLDITLEKQKPGKVTVELHRFGLEAGAITLVPRDGTGALAAEMTAGALQGQVTFLQEMTQLDLDLTGMMQDPQGNDQGTVAIRGAGAVNLSQLNLQLQTQDLALSPLFNFAQNLVPRQTNSGAEAPFSILSGILSSDVELEIVGRSVANLQGNLGWEDMTLSLEGLPTPVTQVKGKVQIQTDRLEIQSLEGEWGQLRGAVKGKIQRNVEQWQKSIVDLSIDLDPFQIPDLFAPLGVEATIPVQGVWQTQLKILGNLSQLDIQGELASVEGATVAVNLLQPSLLDFKTMRTRFQTQVDTPLQAPIVEPGEESPGDGSPGEGSQGKGSPGEGQGDRLRQNKPFNISLTELRLLPKDGGEIAGSGDIQLNTQAVLDSPLDLDLSLEDLPGDILAQRLGFDLPIRLGTIVAQSKISGTIVNPKAQAQVQALSAEYPTRGLVQLDRNGWIVDEALVSLAGGVLQVKGEQLNPAENWSLAVEFAGVNFDRLDIALPGVLDGVAVLSAPRNTFTLNQIQAKGAVTFSEGISIIKDPLNAQFTWDGNRILVGKAKAPGFGATGIVGVTYAPNRFFPDITDLNLQVELADYDLAKLPVRFPDPVKVQAGVNFQGRVTGSPEAPWVQGMVQVEALTVNTKPFEPKLEGPFRLNPEGVALRLQGQRDFIETRLDPDFLPQTGTIVWNGGVAKVQRQPGDHFAVRLDTFPVAALGLELPTPQIGQQPILGTASGDAIVALLPEFSVVGNLAVNQPALGHLKGQTLVTNFRLADGILGVQEGVLAVGNSQFQFSGRAIVDAADPTYQLDLRINQGQVGDFLQVFRWFDLIDVQRGFREPVYDRAEAVQLPPVSVSNQPLRLQLYRFSEVKNQITQAVRRRQASQKLPPVQDLVGDFTGQIALRGSLQTGLNADFRFAGDQWQWGSDYSARNVEVAGDFKDNRLTLQPAQFTLNDQTQVKFQGIVGNNPQYGTLSVTALPLTLVKTFIDLPLDVKGALNLEATLSGSVEDPQLVGEINLMDGTLNGAALQTERTGFSYSDQRLSFGGTLLVSTAGTDPLEVSGEFPAFGGFTLPPLTLLTGQSILKGQDFSRLRRGDGIEGEGLLPGTIVTDIASDGSQITLSQPVDERSTLATLTIVPRLRLNLNVANEGIKILNLLTQEKLTWRSGQGAVSVELGGTVKRPIASGSAEFSNATVTVQGLPPGDEITDLSGLVKFATDRIVVEQLKGRLSEGAVSAQGVIPLVSPLTFTEDLRPLEVVFTDLVLNIPGKYRGGAAGEVQVLGTLLAPRLTGEIRANQGNVILPDPSSAIATVFEDSSTASLALGFSPLILENLNLKLGEDITIASDPLFNFKATGGLVLNGGLENLQPKGTIKLTRGQVNLFTTTFLLARGAKNEAVFRPQTGLDPELDIEMVASVTEVSRRRPNAGPIIASEISDGGDRSFGELQTIRIRASVDGPASGILQNLSLSSRPARTPTELYSLMGGGFVNTLGQGGNSTLALANLAGSALINNLQAAINSVLSGPVDLRLFPVVIESQNRKDNSESDRASELGSDTLALGAELGVNLTNSLSFSVLRLLTLDLPTRFNVNYQINNNLQLRATSDFQEENRFVLEYEARF